MTALLANVDSKTIEFRRFADHSPAVSEPPTFGMPKITTHRLTLFSWSVMALAGCVLSLIWISVMAVMGDSISKVVIVVGLNVLFFVTMGVCAVMARDYRDRVQRAAVEMLRTELQDGLALLKQSVLVAVTESRTQTALLRSEMMAQFEKMPGRFDAYGEQKVIDHMADEAIAPIEEFEPLPPAQLSIVRQAPRAR
jgi:hypothetical protein